MFTMFLIWLFGALVMGTLYALGFYRERRLDLYGGVIDAVVGCSASWLAVIATILVRILPNKVLLGGDKDE